MGESVTVEIDKATYQEFEQLARSRGTKLEETLTEAIQAYLEQKKAYMKDPFFQIGKAGRSGLGDLAEAHDEYLYECDNEG
ncbi:MAG TPA: hypothetical protein PLN41_12825 [Methanothrix sp.]|jgi:hypothetical protein|nr:hypothetical protein [Methanothrix sp.]